jgi:hypothetical protein
VEALDFLALHSLWTTDKKGFCPPACLLSVQNGRQVLNSLALATLTKINGLFGSRPSLGWKPQREDLLERLLEFFRDASAGSLQTVVSKPPPKPHGLIKYFSWAAFIGGFSGTPEVDALRGVLADREREHEHGGRGDFLSWVQ